MSVSVQWSHLGLGSLVAFLVGWWIFGLFGAVLLAIVVMLFMGIIRVDGRSVFSDSSRSERRRSH